MTDRRVTQGLLEADHLDEDQVHRFTQVLLEVDYDENLLPPDEGGGLSRIMELEMRCCL